MTTREQQKRETRARVLATAQLLFALRGFSATRTADVARAAGVAHGTVFVHFPTREDLVTAAIEAFAQQLIDRLGELVEAGAGLREVLAAHLAGIAEHEEFYARLIQESATLPDDSRNLLLGIQSVISFQIQGAAQRERDAGHIRPVPQHLLFNTWIGLLHHYLANGDLFAPGQSVLQRRADELLDHYLGLLAP